MSFNAQSMIYRTFRHFQGKHNRPVTDVILPPRIRFAGLLLLVMLIACKKQDDVQSEQLFGKWDIWKAERNGNETPYLRGGYMIFEKNGVMTVNLTGTDEKGTFILEDNILHGPLSTEYQIESIRQDSMRIRFRKSTDSEFLFYLHKNKDGKN